jgi:hypothetical protein
VAETATGQAISFSLEQREAIYRKLLYTDAAIKTGKMDEMLAIDMLACG